MRAGDLQMTPEELEEHKNLVAEADKLYGSHHYDHYDFLLLLSDKVGGSRTGAPSVERERPAGELPDRLAE